MENNKSIYDIDSFLFGIPSEKQLQLDQDAMKQSMEAMEDEKKWREENGGPMDFSPPPTYNISDPDEDKS